MTGNWVILLNGIGSVGKTSAARAFQGLAKLPFLHVQMDSFLEMLPPHLRDHPDAFSFVTVQEDGRPVVEIREGPRGRQLLSGMRHAIAAMADAGNNLIVDDVLLGDAHRQYRNLLKNHRFRIVGLHAPLEIVEQRERARGDRAIGLARWQWPRVHQGVTYDLEIDTVRNDPEACAGLIASSFDL